MIRHPSPTSLFSSSDPHRPAEFVAHRASLELSPYLEQAIPFAHHFPSELSFFLTQPHLRAVASSLGRFLTHYIPSNLPHPDKPPRRIFNPLPSESLFTKCFLDGLSSLSQNPSHPHSFLSGLFSAVPLVSSWHVYPSRGLASTFWDFTRGQLHDWIDATSTIQYVCPRHSTFDPYLSPKAVIATVVAASFDPPSFDAISHDLASLYPDHPQSQ